MPITTDIFDRRKTHFVLWCPAEPAQAPELIIGQLTPGNPPTLTCEQRFALVKDASVDGLWVLSANDCNLQHESIYHYWFEVDDSRSQQQPPARIAVTDPFAFCVDWRLAPPGTHDWTQPAAVVKCMDGDLVDCDPGGEVPDYAAAPMQDDTPLDELPPNMRLVIYELPTAWAMSRSLHEPERAVATFLDVAALVDERHEGANFAELSLFSKEKSYLTDLGINALECLPQADSYYKREWGYDTAHYLAPDYELGYPEGNLSPTANRDLATLVASCHQKRIRFFVDMVMAFAKEDPYNHIDTADFHIDDPSQEQGDPDAWTSTRGGGGKDLRNGFGSTLWRYAKQVKTYDPVNGETADLYPARQLMFTYLTRWMRDFRIDGVRVDTVENIANWDFLGDFTALGRRLWNQRWQEDQGLDHGVDERFLVVGEELSLPFDLLRQRPKRVDALWNEDFQARIRAAILGENVANEPTFEWTVKKAIDCRLLGFADGAEAINYFTKHDLQGLRKERLFNMLRGFPEEQKEKRIKLAFVCLLTAVGIPLILAGEEFADEHDFFDQDGHVTQEAGKQIDPVNFSRLTTTDPSEPYAPMRRRIHAYVKRLIKFRTETPALWVNDTDFIHMDFDAGKRVLVWKRGGQDGAPVIVVANFSDYCSPQGGEYVVPTWPHPAPSGKEWFEISRPDVPDAYTAERKVDPMWVGREAIYPWEAKVYILRDA